MATVLSLLIILFGAIGLFFLPVREYPSVDSPIITVSTTYTGANADIIENQITEKLEESINGIAGISSLNSTSSDGRSNITVEFNIGTDMEAAANDVRDRVSRAIRNLPPDCDPPVVTKADADASSILMMNVYSKKRNLLELSEISNNIFKERLQTVEGVSEVRIWGEKRYAIRLLMNPAKLAFYGLTPADVRNALSKENIELPSGRIEGDETELAIRTMGRMETLEQFNNLIIKEQGNSIVRMKDIGKAVLSSENENTIFRGNNGIPMTGVAINPQPGANHIAIVNECYKRLEQIKKDIPEDIEVKVALDTTTSIRKSITEVEETLLIAFILVVLVIYLFLRSWRSTLIPIIAIPISLTGTFFIMYVAGFSINILTLLGVVLATGLVVDDAIVVMENIYKKVEKGMEPRQAGHEGTKEIIFAIISTTITLAAVFLPIIFLQGLTGKLFREFAVVVAGAVIISAFVSLTLTPMMSSRILRQKMNPRKWYLTTEAFFERMTSSYHNSLHHFMRKPWIALMIMGASFLIIFGIRKLVPSELAPMEDKGRLRISVTAPEGTSYEAMDQYVLGLLRIVDTIPEKEHLIALTAPGFGSSGSANTAMIRLGLSEPSKRDKSQMQLADELNLILGQQSFARAIVSQEQTISNSRMGGLPIQYVIQAPDFEKLRDFVPVFMDKVRENPAFQVSDLNVKFNKPEIKIEINRDKAHVLGVSTYDIAQSLQLFFSGQRYGYFIYHGKQYYIIGQADKAYRNKPADLSSIYVKNKTGKLIQLDELLHISYQSNPPQLYRYNRFASATVSAAPAEGYTLGQGLDVMDEIAKETLDESFYTALTGTSKDFRESMSNLMFALALALLIIYLILAAQFESYRDPLIIMFTVPLAFAGAILSLWIFGQTMNIFSQIGIIMLIGIVTKNGILIVEFANQLKSKGYKVKEAALEAATLRMRPILMTSLATVLGALPIAFGLGASAKSRVSMGIVIIGGLMFSLILTLYIIPSLYSLLSSKKVRFTEHSEITEH